MVLDGEIKKQRKIKNMKKMSKGFTLVEIMIVVAIIAILAAVAIPNFIQYRKRSQQTACISNLKQIQTAKEQILMAGKTVSKDIMFGDDNDKYIKKEPHCPADETGTYTLGDAETEPECSKFKNDADYPHVLPGETASSAAS